MWYEIKFGLIGFLVGTVAISAATFASNYESAKPKRAHAPAIVAPAPPELLTLADQPKPVAAAKESEGQHPMSAWRRAYIAEHGHPPAAQTR
jgi:hypothetical protein